VVLIALVSGCLLFARQPVDSGLQTQSCPQLSGYIFNPQIDDGKLKVARALTHM